MCVLCGGVVCVCVLVSWYLELVGLLDHHLQPAVLPQDRLPHLSYPPGLLLLHTHLALWVLWRRGGRERGMEREGDKKTLAGRDRVRDRN